ncbi:MAG: hypothetical protein QF749_00170 [Verrucomicrobiota bacterium]|jgi:hypothetical protein|nr:hypothetical protein [Verrucomicrobiota bacterium]MDP7176680.1 hypothetical protein [Verrucomicrobiota bacterium]MDP7292117.1 hypothetical protein [Verrucomicrobiota bacterium]MDP7440239.1 hypothetical protein [Verrucomicrobiota bacterium]
METLGFIIMLIGGLGGLITVIVLLIAAFQEGIGWGLGSLFCGIVLLVFCIKNFSEVQMPFLANIGFSILFGIGRAMVG